MKIFMYSANRALIFTLLFSPLISEAQTYQSLPELFEADASLKANQVEFEVVSSKQIESRFYPGKRMSKSKLQFTSQVYRGVLAKHNADLHIPAEGIPNAAQGATAIILGGGNFQKIETPEKDWIEYIVTQLGVPCLFIQNAFNAKEFGARNAGELMSFGNQTSLETGDPREDGYYALAKIFSAAATMMEQIPGVKAKRFIVTGSSKGGMAALIACGGDSRIVGSFPTAWNSGNIPEYTRIKGQRWGWHTKPKETGPAGMTAASVMEMVMSPNYRIHRNLFDPFEWGELLDDKFTMPAVGTNDPLFHLLSDDHYYDGLQGKKAFLRVPNYPHGRTAVQHATAWRFAVAAALLDRPIPKVSIKTEASKNEFNLLATIYNGSQNPRGKIHWTTDPTGDYRKAKWKTKALSLPNNLDKPFSVGSWKIPVKGTLAVFIEFSDDHSLGESIVSSNVIELGQAVSYKLDP